MFTLQKLLGHTTFTMVVPAKTVAVAALGVAIGRLSTRMRRLAGSPPSVHSSLRAKLFPLPVRRDRRASELAF